jgi:RNA recognition motif-containing protein
MARKDAPDLVERMIRLKVTGLHEDVTTESLRIHMQSKIFFSMGDLYLPMNLHKRAHRGFAFLRFVERDEAERCVQEMDNTILMGQPIQVFFHKQNSMFTMDTGYITNEELDTIPERASDFEPGMPDAHHDTLKYNARDLSNQVTLKVSNLEDDVTEKELGDLFSQYGELASVYRPFDKGLFPIKPRPCAFVRFMNKRDALEAKDRLNLTLIRKSEMQIELAKVKEWWNQNESRELHSVMEESPEVKPWVNTWWAEQEAERLERQSKILPTPEH